MIRVQAGLYEVMEENRDGWNPDAFKERYSDILDKYDFIVGDWGYGQLRLRGFYDNANRKVPFEQKIATLDEYIHEFCNFGCPYFVLRKVSSEQGLDGSQFDGELIEGQTDDSLEKSESKPYTYGERKERHRHYPPRHNRDQQRPDRQNGSGNNRPERVDKPNKFVKPEQRKDDRGPKERRGFQGARQKVPVSGGEQQLVNQENNRD